MLDTIFRISTFLASFFSFAVSWLWNEGSLTLLVEETKDSYRMDDPSSYMFRFVLTFISWSLLWLCYMVSEPRVLVDFFLMWLKQWLGKRSVSVSVFSSTITESPRLEFKLPSPRFGLWWSFLALNISIWSEKKTSSNFYASLSSYLERLVYRPLIFDCYLNWSKWGSWLDGGLMSYGRRPNEVLASSRPRGGGEENW